VFSLANVFQLTNTLTRTHEHTHTHTHRYTHVCRPKKYATNTIHVIAKNWFLDCSFEDSRK